MTAVSIFLPNLVQGTLAEASGYTMLLVKPSDKSLLNGAGDSLAWAGNGWLTAEVAEPWTETLSVTVVDGDGLVPFGGWLGVGSVVVADGVAELNSGALRAALGMAAADLDDQLDAILAAGGAGTGARTVTITVNDGTTALQNATVRMTEGVNSYTALTDADGVAVFNLDDATYTVSITKSGYSYTGTTLVVNGTETATYSMTAISVTPPTSPSKSAIEVLCVDENVDAESGVAVDFRIVTIPTGDQNIAYKGTKQTATSDVDGIARFEVARGSVCEYKRGEADVWQRVTVDNDSVTNVTSFIGSP